MRKYGVPYKGSKDTIAEDILTVLPSGKRFVDLFGGGFAMSHAALLSGKYEKVLYNDADPCLAPFIRDCIDGKYDLKRFKPEWISREDFHTRKRTDGYVRCCWSFGNNGDDYFCAKRLEEKKRRMFEHIVNGVSFGGAPVQGDTMRERRLALMRYLRKHGSPRCDNEPTERVQSLERLEQLERLERLERLEQLDYREVEYKEGDVVYCDIPYADSNLKYGVEFDYAAFLDWAATRPYPVYVSSYNIDDPRFKCIWEKEKRVNLSAQNKRKYATERLYITGKTE